MNVWHRPASPSIRQGLGGLKPCTPHVARATKRCTQRSAPGGPCQAQDKSTDEFWLQRPPIGVEYPRQALPLAPTGPGPSASSSGVEVELDTPVQSLAAGTPPQQASLVAGQLSWQQWLAHFEQADAAAERKEQVAMELKDAIRQEQYSTATQLKEELNVLEAQDAVASLRRQLDEAVAQQRYDEAAALRDAGLSGLAGWWAGQAEDDPVGHLLHITPEYSRWTGRVFRPRDIAELKVHKPEHMFGRSMLRSAPTAASKPSGSPILEVFVRPKGGSSDAGSTSNRGGSAYLHQAIALRLPTTEEVEQRRIRSNMHSPPASTPTSPFSVRPEALHSITQQSWLSDVPPPPPVPLASTSSISHTVRLSVSIRRDGTARIAGMLPVAPVLSHLSAWEATEAEETMRMLRWSSAGPEPASGNPSAASGAPSASNSMQYQQQEMFAVQADGTLQLPDLSTSDDIVDVTSQHAMSSMDAEDGAVALAPEPRPGCSNVPQGSRAMSSMYAPDDGLEEFYMELMRVPARMELLGRDQLVYHMPEDTSAISTMRGRSGGASADSWVPLAGALGADRGGRLFGGNSVAGAGTVGHAAGDDASGSEEGMSSFEVIVPMAAAASSPVAVEGDASCIMSAPTDAVSAEALNILADQVAQSLEAKVGHSAPREEIAEALREVVRRVAAGELLSAVDVRLGAVDGRPESLITILQPVQSQPLTAPATKTTRISYKRLTVDQLHTDPLTGLYLGSFGPHGPELLQLSRNIVDGEEMVYATKVTGDENVPAGLVSFRAKIGRNQKLSARDVYPEELGIAARYKGEGRVAQKGFTQPTWVSGELLVFNSKGNPLTVGAELGFVWAVPGEKRFLILLNRVNLSDVGK